MPVSSEASFYDSTNGGEKIDQNPYPYRWVSHKKTTPIKLQQEWFLSEWTDSNRRTVDWEATPIPIG